MKKIICIMIFLFCTILSFAEYYDGAYWFGKSCGSAIYLGTTATVRAKDLNQQDFKESSPYVPTLRVIEKLTKEEQNLLWGALKAYDYKPSEVYQVTISTGYISGRGWLTTTVLYVEIQKDMSVVWYGCQF